MNPHRKLGVVSSSAVISQYHVRRTCKVKCVSVEGMYCVMFMQYIRSVICIYFTLISASLKLH